MPVWLSVIVAVWSVLAIFKLVLELRVYFADSMSSDTIEIEDNDPQLLVPLIRSRQTDLSRAREKFMVAQTRQRSERLALRTKQRTDLQK